MFVETDSYHFYFEKDKVAVLKISENPEDSLRKKILKQMIALPVNSLDIFFLKDVVTFLFWSIVCSDLLIT